MSNDYPIDGEEHEGCEDNGTWIQDMDYECAENTYEERYECNGCGDEAYYD